MHYSFKLGEACATRFATRYLTLGCLHENKEASIRMFTSKNESPIVIAKTGEEKALENIVVDKEV